MRRLMLRWYLFIVFFFLERDLQCSEEEEEEEANGEGEIDIYALRMCFEGHPTLGTITRYC